MIKKQEFLDKLKRLKMDEEEVIPIYRRHLPATIFWTKIDRKKIEKARRALMVLAQESIAHKEIIESVIERVKKEDKDAY